MQSQDDNTPDQQPYGNSGIISRTMRVHDMPDDDRPREKAILHGIKSLSNAELIAIALGSGIPGRSVIEISRDILHTCDNRVNRLANLTLDSITAIKGLGNAKAVSLLAAIELGGRVHNAAATDDFPVIKTPADIYGIMRETVQFLDHEEFWVLMLDRRNSVRRKAMISSGGTSATVVDPKLLFHRVIEARASGIALVHNHPSGNLKPSNEDIALTRRIAAGCKTFDINLLDHVIISTKGYYSFVDSGVSLS